MFIKLKNSQLHFLMLPWPYNVLWGGFHTKSPITKAMPMFGCLRCSFTVVKMHICHFCRNEYDSKILQAQECHDTEKIELELSVVCRPHCIAAVVLYLSLSLQMFWQGNIARVVYPSLAVLVLCLSGCISPVDLTSCKLHPVPALLLLASSSCCNRMLPLWGILRVEALFWQLI